MVSKSESKHIERKRIKGELWIVLILLTTFIVVTGSFVHLSKSIIPGVYTSNISDYAEMRTSMINRYPWAPDFLPTQIPESAVIYTFEATDDEMLQASPRLLLEMILGPEEAQEELSRLQQIESNGRFSNKTDFPFFSSEEQFAKASYEPETRLFSYQISGE